MVLKLQQSQYDLKKNFLQCLVFPMLFCQSDGPRHQEGGGGGGCKGGGVGSDSILAFSV